MNLTTFLKPMATLLVTLSFCSLTSAQEIVGIGIAKSDDHVYVWYRDGTVSAGTSKDLDYYRAPYTYQR